MDSTVVDFALQLLAAGGRRRNELCPCARDVQDSTGLCPTCRAERADERTAERKRAYRERLVIA